MTLSRYIYQNGTNREEKNKKHTQQEPAIVYTQTYSVSNIY